MKNWTDSCINWNQLPGTEVKRLIATWGFTPEQIAKYDKKHGFNNAPAKAPVVAVPAKTAPVAKKAPAKKAVVTKAPSTRQKHTGADGEVKFVEHRNLFVGFFGGKVVVTKRTAEQCLEVLRKDYNQEV
jgi:hypothetical protein